MIIHFSYCLKLGKVYCSRKKDIKNRTSTNVLKLVNCQECLKKAKTYPFIMKLAEYDPRLLYL